jgi:hypothetical protein
MTWMRMALLVLCAAAACGGDPGDALVVVQETNTPDPPPPCQEFRYHYTVDYVTECDGSERQVDVCADEELCDAQLAEIVEPLRTCDELHGYTIEIPDGC